MRDLAGPEGIPFILCFRQLFSHGGFMLNNRFCSCHLLGKVAFLGRFPPNLVSWFCEGRSIDGYESTQIGGPAGRKRFSSKFGLWDWETWEALTQTLSMDQGQTSMTFLFARYKKNPLSFDAETFFSFDLKTPSDLEFEKKLGLGRYEKKCMPGSFIISS